MGHGANYLLAAEIAGLLNDGVHHRHQGFSALDAEPLGSDEGSVQVLLELLRRDELAENVLLLLGRKVGAVEHRLHLTGQPLALLLVGDARVLDADVPAIGLAQLRDQIAERSVARSSEAAGADHQVVGGVRQPEVRQRQHRVRLARLSKPPRQRVQVRLEVAELPVRVHQVVDADRRRYLQVAIPGLDRRRRQRAHAGDGGGATVAFTAEREAGKKGLPLRVEACRILEVALVQLGDVLPVSADDVHHGYAGGDLGGAFRRLPRIRAAVRLRGSRLIGPRGVGLRRGGVGQVLVHRNHLAVHCRRRRLMLRPRPVTRLRYSRIIAVKYTLCARRRKPQHR